MGIIIAGINIILFLAVVCMALSALAFPIFMAFIKHYESFPNPKEKIISDRKMFILVTIVLVVAIPIISVSAVILKHPILLIVLLMLLMFAGVGTTLVWHSYDTEYKQRVCVEVLKRIQDEYVVKKKPTRRSVPKKPELKEA